jgi:hypothetical protein
MTCRPQLLFVSESSSKLFYLKQFLNLFSGAHIGFKIKSLLLNSSHSEGVKEIEDYLDNLKLEELLNTVIVYDLTSGNRSSFKIDRVGQPADLILKYPEVYWVFLTKGKIDHHLEWFRLRNDEEYSKHKVHLKVWQFFHFVEILELKKLLYLINRFMNGFRCYFDPTGLRKFVANCQAEGLDEGNKVDDKDANNLKKSESNTSNEFYKGVAIDEEMDYCLLNGYLLFRNNFETFMISTFSEMKSVLKLRESYQDPDEKDINESNLDFVDDSIGDFRFILEDVNLLFPDVTDDNNKVILPETGEPRPILFCVKEKKDKVSESEKTKQKDDFVKEKNVVENTFIEIKELLQNRRQAFEKLYLENLKLKTVLVSVNDLSKKKKELGIKGVECITKPHGGIFDPQLLDCFKDQPPPKLKFVSSKDFGHSARGRNQIIAKVLMNRAHKIKSNIFSTQAAVHGAILAEEARRVLGNKTWSLSIEALSLKHQMEVLAECSFIGASKTLQVEKRFNEIEKDIEELMIANNLVNQRQKYDARLEIFNNLRKCYRQFDQDEEEEIALTKVRDCTWHLNWEKNKEIGLFQTIMSGFEWYLNLLLKSFKNIIYGTISWLAVFAIFYGLTEIGLKDEDKRVDAVIECLKPLYYAWEYFLFSVLVFFSGVFELGEVTKLKNPSIIRWIAFWSLMGIETVLGYLHLGVLIAYLYQKISRK